MHKPNVHSVGPKCDAVQTSKRMVRRGVRGFLYIGPVLCCWRAPAHRIMLRDEPTLDVLNVLMQTHANSWP